MIYLLIFLILLQIADFATTYIIFARGGREKNTFLNRLMVKFGTFKVLLISKLLASGLCVGIYFLEPYFLIPLIGWYGWVVVHNLREV